MGAMCVDEVRPLAVALDAPGGLSAAECGPKAATLSRMIAAGVPVPPGFCLTREAADLHIVANSLGLRVETLVRAPGEAHGPERAGALCELREVIEAADLAGELAEAVAEHLSQLPDGPLAVRSSATAEDLPGHSFAGLHDTALGVTGVDAVLAAVRGCWASLWTERAFGYRERNGLAHSEAAMAVIVQQLVPAEASGVAFTADPVTGDGSRVLIELAAGLGDALVGGRVQPERMVVTRAGAGTQFSGKEALPHRVAALALAAEAVLGAPADVEWAAADGEVWLLQARPITTCLPRHARPDRQVWSNANTGEVAPDVATPMTWSMLDALVHALMTCVFRGLGMDLSRHRVVGLVAGRVYFNLNTMISCARRIPGLGDRHTTEMFGGDTETEAQLARAKITESDIPYLDVSKLHVALRIPSALWHFATYPPTRAEAVLAALRQRVDGEYERAAGRLDAADLLALIRGIVDDILHNDALFEVVGVGKTADTILYDLCRRWFGAEGSSLASRMMAGIGGNEHAMAGLALAGLARMVRDDPGLGPTVLSHRVFDDLRAELCGSASGRAFIEAWDRFMAEHGHHCRGELELSNPRWAETPDEVLSQVRSYMAADRDFVDAYEALAEDRETATRETIGRLWDPVRRGILRHFLHRARKLAPPRESVKSQIVRRIALLRSLLLRLGDCLVERHVLARRDDTWFLRLDELDGVVSGEADVGASIRARRAEYRHNLSLSPPQVVIGEYSPGPECKPGADPPTRLTGIPCNPGVVVGPARVIEQGGHDEVLPGEVLVAPVTDPGWTPYLINAAALVVDMGGILSHGSIIAREYGIPAVVNVGPATRLIRTGQLLRVDGAAGVVDVFPDA